VKLLAIGLAAFVFLSSILAGFFIKNSRSAAKKTFTFNYYPEVNVYYDYSQSNLLYTLDGGKSWTKVHRHKDSLPATLGKAVTFQSPVADSWTQNAAHRATYSGVNTNFTVEPFAVRIAVDSEAKMAAENSPQKNKKKQSKRESKKGKEGWLKDLKDCIKKVGAKFRKENKDE
jgi:hypothetical protein